MFLSDASVRRPIAMGALIIGLALLGLNAYRKIGLELMPQSDIPYITITTVYPGASPEQIEVDVAKRIEDKMMTLDGVKHMSTTCMENVCQVLLEFRLGVDVDIAATDVREKLDLVRSDFPAGVEDPKVLKFDINSVAVANLALTGDVSSDELYDYADNTLTDRLTTIPGVAEAQLIGGAEREVHILLDRDRLAARGLSTLQVMQTVKQGIGKVPAGRLRDHGREYTVEFDADFADLRRLDALEIANADGQRVYLRDVGRVEMTTEERRQTATLDGKPAIAIRVVKKSEANAVAVVNATRAAMDKLNNELPGGMELHWIRDDGRFIRASVDSASTSVLQGILLTAAVLFFFLYNFRALIVVSVTMPLTVIIGLFIMMGFDYTLNTMTLISIGMSVGILVTNSIVVLEAIEKHLQSTGDPKLAARIGTAESVIPVLASAGTNIVVLFPVAIMHSLVGEIMRPLIITMIIMTVVSLFISFTLTPLLCAILLKPKKQNSRSPLAYLERGFNWCLEGVIAGYRWCLRFCERHRWAGALVILATLGLFLQAVSLAPKIGGSFFPDIDKGELTVKLEFPTSYSLARTNERTAEAEALLSDLPYLRSTTRLVGKVEGMIGKASEGVYLSQVELKFAERTERPVAIDALSDMARERLAAFPDAIITVSIPSVIGGTQTPIELEIYGDDLDTLDQLALKTRDQALTHAGFVAPDTTVRPGKAKLRVTPRRATLSDLSYPASALGLTLRGNLEGLEAGTFKQGDRNYDIVVKLDEEESKSQVERYLLPGVPGHSLPLTSLGTINETVTPIQITRKDKQRISKVTSNLAPDLPIGKAVALLSVDLNASSVPPGYSYNFSGDVERMKEAQGEFGEAALIAMVLVVLVLAAIMESFRQPVLILVTVPLGLIGMLWALYIAGESISMFVILGGVMLIGIVVNNAILIMDQFNILVKEGVPRHQAMIQAACDRFRPILMITLAAVLGMLPMALGTGIGAELRTGVGVASAGGILVSGILTLIVLPVLYDLFTRGRKTKS